MAPSFPFGRSMSSPLTPIGTPLSAGVPAELSENMRLPGRADEQHRCVMRGDERGTYGQYPPAAV